MPHNDPYHLAEEIRRLAGSKLPESILIQYTLLESPGPKSDRMTIDQGLPMKDRAHSPDFASIYWSGSQYRFTPKQRPIVAMLWQAMENGTHYVGSAALLEVAEIENGKLSDVFRGNLAWKSLIMPGLLCGGPAGTYRLAPLLNEPES